MTEDGGGRWRTVEDGGGRRRKVEEGGGRWKEEEGGGMWRRVEEGGGREQPLPQRLDLLSVFSPLLVVAFRSNRIA